MKTRYEELLAEDMRLRGEFAKAFKWTGDIPTWEQIFVGVGRLLVLEELKQKVIPINFGEFRPHQ